MEERRYNIGSLFGSQTSVLAVGSLVGIECHQGKKVVWKEWLGRVVRENEATMVSFWD